MPTKEEKQRRKAIVQELARAEQTRSEAQLPLAKADIKALFDAVDTELQERGCNHTLAHTLAFLQRRNLSQESVIAWLAEYHGYCDCEVIANVEERWGEIVGSV